MTQAVSAYRVSRTAYPTPRVGRRFFLGTCEPLRRVSDPRTPAQIAWNELLLDEMAAAYDNAAPCSCTSCRCVCVEAGQVPDCECGCDLAPYDCGCSCEWECEGHPDHWPEEDEVE